MRPNLGSMEIDLPVLLETRMLIQANSGGGKSYALRRVLEQTASGVQQIVIDPEGEFSSLREKIDYLICSPSGGDAVATPATAAALARAIWESGVSAIVDIYELRAHDRVLFVRRFLEALTNAPKKIWHPTLVAIDEIHVFAPQQGQAESLGAVTDLATRGRKRGLALLGATQRLSKLHKDVAAELLNKMIGRTGLDVDLARAADELGMSKADARAKLQPMDPGTFFVYGPALSRAVTLTRIGAVRTTHPQPGQRMAAAPPPASKALLATLAKIEGLQREAVQEVRTVDELKAEVAKLRNIASRVPTPAPTGHTDAQVQALIAAAVAREHAVADHLRAALESVRTTVQGVLTASFTRADAAQAIERTFSSRAVKSAVAASVAAASRPSPLFAMSKPARDMEPTTALRSGAIRILQQLAARAPAGYSRPQVGALTQFSHKGGTFGTYFSDLRRGGFIEERSGLVYATETGIRSLGADVPPTPTTHLDAMRLWNRALRSGAFAMLEAICEAGDSGLDRNMLAVQVGMQASGGTFGTYLSDLRRNGLIVERDKRLFANDVLYPSKVAA